MSFGKIGTTTGGGSGEINTASNVNTQGQGLFKQKTAENLEFKGVKAGSNKIDISDSAGDNTVAIDVNETNLDKYTKSEVDTLLGGKSDTSHSHDDRYYTESEIDTQMGNKSDSTHTHASTDLTDSANIPRLDQVNNFTEFPETPSSAPSTDYQVANKKYVDANSALADYTIEKETGNCLNFNGSNNYINTNKTISELGLDYTDTFSIVFSHDFDKITSYIFGAQENSPDYKGVLCNVSSAGKLIFNFNYHWSNERETWSSADGAINASIKNVIVLTHDNSTRIMKLYVNGEEKTFTKAVTGSALSHSCTNAFDFYIGALNNYNDSAYQPIQGSMYGFGVYPKVLTTEEITGINNGEITTGASIFYPMSEGVGTKIYDVSGNQNHKTMQGTTTNIWNNTQDNLFYNNDYGFTNLCYFDGSDDRIVTDLVPTAIGEIEASFIPANVSASSGGVVILGCTEAGRCYLALKNDKVAAGIANDSLNVIVGTTTLVSGNPYRV